MEYKVTIIVGRGEFSREYTLLENHYFIEFHSETSNEQIDQFLKEYALEPIEQQFPRKETLPKTEEKVPKIEHQWVKASVEADMTAVREDNLIRRIAPIYIEKGRGTESAAAPLPDVLILEFPQKPSEGLLKDLKDTYGLRPLPNMSDLLGNFWYFTIGEEGKEKLSAYELLDQIQKIEAITFVEYDWIMMQPDTFIPTDTYWGNQWTMEQIQVGGPGYTGWDVQTGDVGVIIAVLDSGCDLGHPDINYTPVATHFNGQQALAGNLPPYNASPVRPHGTCVAGIAAAVLYNALGVAGVAGGCTVLPAFHGDTSAGEAASINWAVAEGCNVINMSSHFVPTATLQAAVQNAANAGVVMAAAAGNENVNGVVFPAAYPEVIAVGASDQNDERKRPASPDGECWWGSNWGTDLDIMAPGVLCWTTDEQGAAGYNQNGNAVTHNYQPPPSPLACLGPGGTLTYPTTGDTAGDYFANFNGTSAATPHVAGVAALMLSVNPALGTDTIRTILQRTAEKIDPVNANYDTNGWSNQYGFGRVNAWDAVGQAAWLSSFLSFQ